MSLRVSIGYFTQPKQQKQKILCELIESVTGRFGTQRVERSATIVSEVVFWPAWEFNCNMKIELALKNISAGPSNHSWNAHLMTARWAFWLH